VRAITLCGPLYGGARARRVVSPAGTRGSSAGDTCGRISPGMHGVLLGLVAAGPRGGGAAV